MLLLREPNDIMNLDQHSAYKKFRDRAHKMAAHFARLYPWVELDDFVAAADLGLWTACGKLKPTKSVQASGSFALAGVRWALIDQLRDGGRQTLAQLRARAKYVQAVSAVEQSTGKTAGLSEIRAKLGLGIEEFRHLLGQVSPRLRSLLDAPDDFEKMPLDLAPLKVEDLVDDSRGPDTQAGERKELVDLVQNELQHLPVTEQKVLRGIYMEGRQSTALALELGLTKGRVSQLASQGIELLRKRLAHLVKESA
jgi:RNA polymerase sigma factor for flagellar operon FliA